MMKSVKLSALIKQLEKARDDYIARHDIEPTIWEWDEYEGLQLSAGVKRKDCATYAIKPYKNYKRIRPVT
jgi:hypothetical protein